MKERVLLFLLICVLGVGNAVGIYTTLTANRTLHVWDLQPLWQAGRWLTEGRGSPYSDEMTRLLQMQSYGRLAEEGEDPRAFVYPLYALLLVLPLIFLPLPWAQAVWFTVLECSLIVGVIGAVRLAGWRLSVVYKLFLVVWGFLLYPLAWALVLGQISILIFALIVAALLALQSGRETWAGICLALITAKPQMSFLLVPAVLLWALFRRRYRLLFSFVVTMTGLLLVSFIVLPGWLPEMVRAGVGYFDAQPFSPPVAMFGNAVAGMRGGGVVSFVMTALLVGGLAWMWWREGRDLDLPLGSVGLTLVVSALVAPRTSMVNQVSLLLPCCLLFAELARLGRWGRWLVTIVLLVVLVGLWMIDLLWFPPLASGEHWRMQQRIISPILPTLLLIGLVVRTWWLAKKRT